MITLDLIIGPMFSGKSTELIKKVRQLKVLKKNYLIVKPIIDDRYEKDYVVSHNKDKEECLAIKSLNDINMNKYKNINTIFIEEAQFFENLKHFVLECIKNKINCVVAGLDGDFEKKPFGEILDLIPHCDNIIKLKSLCLKCNDGTKAIFSKRIINDNSQVLVGTNDIYIPVCREHYQD